ncbi:MAG: hypothetical protein ACERKZ_00385 [Lachnotalea sp.]
MNKIKIILRGRYGIDQLNLTLLIMALILCIITAFTNNNKLLVVCWIPLSIYAYRALSKQHILRYKENIFYMKLLNPFLNPIYLILGRMKDKEHKYCNCPSCNQVIRVEKQKGKSRIFCPICKSEFIK